MTLSRPEIKELAEGGRFGPVERSFREVILNGAGLTTEYQALDPAMRTAIFVSKNGESATVDITYDVFDEDGVALATLADADVLWISKSTGTADYEGEGTYNITGVRIVTTPAAADVDYTITQVRG